MRINFHFNHTNSLEENTQTYCRSAMVTTFKMIAATIVLFLLSTAGRANSLQSGQISTPIKMSYFEDGSGTLAIEDLTRDFKILPWKQLDSSPNFGYDTGVYWYHFKVSNLENRISDQLIEIGYPMLDFVDYYQYKNKQLEKHILTGDRTPFYTREVNSPDFVFSVRLAPRETQEFFLRVQTQGTHQVPVRLWQQRAFFEHIGKTDQMHAIYFGILAVVVFFNLFIYFALKEKTYLYYAFSTLSFLMFFAIFRGKMFQIVWPDSPWLHNKSLLIVIPLTLIFSALFTRSFLNLQRYSVGYDRLIKALMLISVACVIAAFVLDYNASIRLSVLMAIPTYLALLFCGPYIWRKGNQVAGFYTIAWGMLTLGTTLAAFNKYGFLPSNFFTEFGMQIGSTFEALLLSAALAYRVYREHEDRIRAQENSLKEYTERRDAELKLLHQSLHHPITKLPNRACFERQVNDTIRNTNNSRLGICIIELRRFAEINKTLGHQNTDVLLAELSVRMQSILINTPGILSIQGATEATCVASLEGASFGILVDADYAEARTEHINDILRELLKPVEFKGMMLELYPVVGVAICPENGLNASVLLRHAHVAVESQHAQDRHLAYYKPEQDQYNARRLTIISELKQTIRDDDLELYFQPKYHLQENRVVGLEALIRWNHHRYGFVRPDEFVPIAETTGMIRPLTRWVIRHAIQSQKFLFDKGYDFALAINISAANLREKDLVDYLSGKLRDEGVPAESIHLELTETSMMLDPVQSISKLEALKKVGVKISVDDFGSGYSSLAYLKKLPADEIKIDRALVYDIASQKSNHLIVKSTIEMCHSLGFSVVAEGVETEEMLNELKQLECDQVQGYYLTPPLPMDKILLWLETDNPGQVFAS